jgi:putative FmdB family regulatory protein
LIADGERRRELNAKSKDPKKGRGVGMPFYRYQCEVCGDVFKMLVQNGDSTPIKCPECESEKTKRLLPRIGVIYKGNGYYSTDYAKKGNKSKATTSSKVEE